MKKNCLQCNKTFEKAYARSIKSWETARFCSKECFDMFRRGKPSCSPSTAFKKGQKPSIKVIEMNRKRFTGSSNPKWKGGQIEHQCKICKIVFKTDSYRKNAKVCSLECKKVLMQSLEWRKHMSETHKQRVEMGLHNSYKGGITPINKQIRKSLEYKLWREAIFKRDNYICQECGVRGGELHPHHIKAFALFPELRFAIDNGITVCEMCHYRIHTFSTNIYQFN